MESAFEMAEALVAERDNPTMSEAEWERVLAACLDLVGSEESPRELGRILALDEMMSLPFDVAVAIYERLFDIGADDVLTRMCYARYLLFYGYERDLAERILSEVEEPAKAANLWKGSIFGHHPVLLRNLPSRG